MSILKKAKYYKTVTNQIEMGECEAEVAFVGRSNVGKSSVLNALCGQKKLAFTSQRPGMTRTINIFSVDKKHWVVDLPGYGFAHGPAADRIAWQAMIEEYLLRRESLRMVFLIVDAFVGPTKLDLEMALWLQSQAIPYSIVANKCDKVRKSEQVNQRRIVANTLDFNPECIHWVSAEKSNGIKNLEQAVVKILEL